MELCSRSYLTLLANVLPGILHKVLLIARVKISRYCSTINFTEDYFRQQSQLFTRTRTEGEVYLPFSSGEGLGTRICHNPKFPILHPGLFVERGRKPAQRV